MKQSGSIFYEKTCINIELPSPTEEVIPGVVWGSISAFPSPAYWAYQVFARRINGKVLNYKLGSSLKEEVAACLLGGYGIPASIGLAAFKHLKNKGTFEANHLEENQIRLWLSEPLSVDGSTVHYRFVKQKAKYLAHALQKITDETAPTSSGKQLRNWLLEIPGIGFKTASWIARNWLDANDVAILDIHVLRAGILGGFFKKELTVEKDYLELEQNFLELATGLGVKASELDAVIWLEMMSYPNVVHEILRKNSLLSSTKNSRSNTKQAALFV